MKRYVSVTMILVFSLSVVSFVSAQPGAERNAAQPENVTITYMTSQDWVKPCEQDLGKKFEQETGIKIDYQIVPSDQYQNLLKIKLLTKEMTDIFGNQSGKFDIVSLLDIENNGVDLSSEEWVKRTDPLAVEQLTVNGKVYGLPLIDSSSSWVMVYNKKIFKNLKLDIPTTYAQFKALCARIAETGVTPVYECLSDGWHHVLWFPELGGRFDQVTPGLSEKLNNNKAVFAGNQTMLTVLTQFKELTDLGYFGKNYASNTYADTEKNMASGKYAMTVGNYSLPARIETAFPEAKQSDFGYFLIPLADNQVLNINPNMPSKFIYAKSRNIEAAKKYFAYISRTENLQYMVDNEPAFMTLPYSGLKSKYSADIQDVFKTYQVRGTVYQAQIKYLGPQWMDIGKDMVAMLFTGNPADVLSNIDKRRADMAKAAKDPSWTK